MKPKFPNVTNNLSINFLNTRISRNNKIIELLCDKQDVKLWLEEEFQQQKKYSLQLKDLQKNSDELNLELLIEFRGYLYDILSNYTKKRLN